MALLARAEEQGLAYAGIAFIALRGSERDELLTRLESVSVDNAPIPGLRFAKAQWVRPQLKARVRHLAGTTGRFGVALNPTRQSSPPRHYVRGWLTTISEAVRSHIACFAYPF